MMTKKPVKQKSLFDDDAKVAEDIAIPKELDTPAFRRVRDAWFAQRRARRLSLRFHWVKNAYDELAAIGVENAIKCIKATLLNDWQGIFPERYTQQPEDKPTRKPLPKLGATEDV